MGTSLARRGPLAFRLISGYIYPTLAPLIDRFVTDGNIRTTTKSAGQVVDALFDDQITGEEDGGYYYNGRLLETSREARDEGKRGELWRESVELVGLGEGETALGDWK